MSNTTTAVLGERYVETATRAYVVDADGRVIRRVTSAFDPIFDTGFDDAPTCTICDGSGHGYPGAGPCPLEDRGAWD